jgi:ABC-2 type transport system permease protein
MIATLIALVRKDLQLFARDRTALALTFLLPLALGAVFGTAMTSAFGGGGGGGGGPAPRVALAVEDRDGSERSAALVQALSGAGGLEVSLVDDARRRVAGGREACGLLIPSGWGAEADAGRAMDLVLYRDPGQVLSQQVVLFQLAPVLLPEQLRILGRDAGARVLDLVDFPPAGRERAVELLAGTIERMETLVGELAAAPGENNGEQGERTSTGSDPLRELPRFLGLVSEDVAGLGGDGLPRSAGPSHAFSAMAVMMLLFSVVGAGGTLLQERQEGTLTRLQLTPAAGRAILLGKLVVVGLIALAQLTVLFAFGALVFGVPVAEVPGRLLLVSLAWVLLAMGIGIVFAVACRTQKQLEGLSTLVILVLSAVGGAWFPREITPAWFQTVGGLTPVGWAMDAFHGVLWYGKGVFADDVLDGLWPDLLKMVTGGVLLLALSGWLYRRRFGFGV